MDVTFIAQDCARLVFIFLLIQSTLAQNIPLQPPQDLKPSPKPSEVQGLPQQPSQKWLTLKGQRPLVIARGGFSGLFPESSEFAYKIGLSSSLADTALFCDLQLSKDGHGFCQTGIRLENATSIAHVFPSGKKTHKINGEDVEGWFALDFTAEQLFSNVSLLQSIYSRPNAFDGHSLLPLRDIALVLGRPPPLWLNVQYNSFYVENKIDPAMYIETASNFASINQISSPEIGFLRGVSDKVNSSLTKLVFRIMGVDAVEPTTKQSYGSLLKNLSEIKSFASGIMVPKELIWPVSKEGYLGAPTSIVDDAHREGLEVYASGFANDDPGSFNYSYDPTSEYLQFIDNSKFAVDGFLTDFPSTASETIACLASNKNKGKQGKALIITRNGASGVYPACTDLAYQQAVDDGADIIDCTVQMSKDGVAFCMDSADLSGDTTAFSTFMSRSTTINQLQLSRGIFSFDLAWKEIQTLKPQLKTRYQKEGLVRNPANKNKGKFMSLPEFLEFAKIKRVKGILINIEHAAYLASKRGLSVTDAVSKALSDAKLEQQTAQQVLIQSEDTSVLARFRSIPTFKRILSIRKTISAAPRQTVEEIKKSADGVSLRKHSVIPTSNFFTAPSTGIVDKMHKANISVFVSVFRNEFVSLAFDYFADPILELATFVAGMGVDGLVTEYPATAAAYMNSPCSDPNAKLPYTIWPAKPGALLKITPQAHAPADAPVVSLDVKDIADPPLPPASNVSHVTKAHAPPPLSTAHAAPLASIPLYFAAIAAALLSN